MMEGAVDDAINSGETTDPYLARIFFSRRVNEYMGGAVLAPWALEELDEHWLLAFNAIFGATQRKEQRDAVESIHEKFRRDHPSFRKY